MAREDMFLGSRIGEQTDPNPTEIGRGRWPCGRKLQVKRKTPFHENMMICLCVSLGPENTQIIQNGTDKKNRGEHETCPRPILARNAAFISHDFTLAQAGPPTLT